MIRVKTILTKYNTLCVKTSLYLKLFLSNTNKNNE